MVQILRVVEGSSEVATAAAVTPPPRMAVPTASLMAARRIYPTGSRSRSESSDAKSGRSIASKTEKVLIREE